MKVSPRPVSPVICIETRHTKAFLKAQQPNKSDRTDVRGIAQMMRVHLFKAVHVKTMTSQERRAMLTARKLSSPSWTISFGTRPNRILSAAG